MPATLPTTPPTTAFRVSGVSPGLEFAVDSGVGAAAGDPAPVSASLPGAAATVATLKVVVLVNGVDELLLFVEEIVEEDVVLVVFEKSPIVLLLKNDGMCAIGTESVDGRTREGSLGTHLMTS